MAAKKSSIDINLIRELADLLNEKEMHEIEVEEGDLRISIARGGSPYVPAQAAQVAVAPPAPAAAPAAPVAAAEPAPAAPATGTAITSPMVGTAYSAPAPGANPFVSVGDSVKAGQTIMIVEAMKTMNQIPCTQDGVVAAINVEDGQPVEFGETLITLK